jgi:hypothetical protein
MDAPPAPVPLARAIWDLLSLSTRAYSPLLDQTFQPGAREPDLYHVRAAGVIKYAGFRGQLTARVEQARCSAARIQRGAASSASMATIWSRSAFCRAALARRQMVESVGAAARRSAESKS